MKQSYTVTFQWLQYGSCIVDAETPEEAARIARAEDRPLDLSDETGPVTLSCVEDEDWNDVTPEEAT